MASLLVPFTRKIRRGSRPGRDVVAIKRALIHKGVLKQRLSTVTPYPGPRFRKAVLTFQKHHGLPATGGYGKRTHAKLVATKAFDAYGAHLMQVWLAKHKRSKGAAVAAAAQYAGAHRPRHYTQGPSRWEPVQRVPWTEHMWDAGDCSSYATGCRKEAGASDPNANGWSSGFTGTLCEHGVKIMKPEVGCYVFFGTGPPWHHVAVVVAITSAGVLLRSHGYEGGPYLVYLNYRGDFGEFRKYD